MSKGIVIPGQKPPKMSLVPYPMAEQMQAMAVMLQNIWTVVSSLVPCSECGKHLDPALVCAECNQKKIDKAQIEESFAAVREKQPS